MKKITIKSLKVTGLAVLGFSAFVSIVAGVQPSKLLDLILIRVFT